MESVIFLGKIVTEFLVTGSNPGVIFFSKNDQIWMSYTGNISEAFVRNIKLIKDGQHVIKSLEGWELCYLLSSSKEEAKSLFIKECLESKRQHKIILNKQFHYSIKGFILEDYRDSSLFLYYVFLMAGRRKVRVLGAFASVGEGEAFIEQLNANGGGFSAASNPLSQEFFKKDLLKEEYKKLMK